MRQILYLLLIAAFLFCSANTAQAGFIIKKHVNTEVVSGANQLLSKNYPSLVREERHSNLYSTISKITRPLFGYRRRPSEWIGIAALISGVLGLFIPGVNFLAILFGVLGMGRNCKTSGLAVAGFVLGVLELLLYLFFGTMFLSLILL